MTAPKVGALALAFLSALDYTGRTNVNRQRYTGNEDMSRGDALADLRALMARHAAAQDECGRLLTRYQDEYVRATKAEAERDRLRAALQRYVDQDIVAEQDGEPALVNSDLFKTARAALAECGSSSVASRPAGELGGGK